MATPARSLALLDSLIPLRIAGRRMVENQHGTLKIQMKLMKIISNSLATSKALFLPMKVLSRGLVCRSFIAPYNLEANLFPISLSFRHSPQLLDYVGNGEGSVPLAYSLLLSLPRESSVSL